MEENIQKPADNGLEKVSEKMDTLLNGLEGSKAVAEETKKAAEEAKQQAQKALDEVVALKNSHSVAFSAKNVTAKDKKALNAELRQFLQNVKNARFGNMQAKAALRTDEATGEYLVPLDFVPSLIDLLTKYPSYVNEAFRLAWGRVGNEREIPNLVARPVFAKVAEGAAKPVSNPVFASLKQKLVKEAVIVVLTKEMVDDAAIDLGAVLLQIIGPALVDVFNAWLFKGNGTGHTGIFNTSGVHTPTIPNVTKLIDLKLAAPFNVRATGKFYIETSLYGELASIARLSAPNWLTYEGDRMRIDGSEVIAIDSTIIGEKKACFGDMRNVIFSPKEELAVRWSDQAQIVDNSGAEPVTHNLFQENKEAYLFEIRADITVVGEVWSVATVGGEESGSAS